MRLKYEVDSPFLSEALLPEVEPEFVDTPLDEEFEGETKGRWRRTSVQFQFLNFRGEPLINYYVAAYVVDSRTGKKVLLGRSAKPEKSLTGTTGVVTYPGALLPAEGTLTLTCYARLSRDDPRWQRRFVGNILTGTVPWNRSRRAMVFRVTQQSEIVKVRSKSQAQVESVLRKEGKIGFALGPIEAGGGGSTQAGRTSGTEREYLFDATVALSSLKIEEIRRSRSREFEYDDEEAVEPEHVCWPYGEEPRELEDVADDEEPESWEASPYDVETGPDVNELEEDEEAIDSWYDDRDSEEGFEMETPEMETPEMETPQRPPPKTRPRRMKIGNQANGVLLDLTVEVLPDKINPSQDTAGSTNRAWKREEWHVEPPEMAVQSVNGVQVVRSVRNIPKITATLTIQTSYRKNGSERLRAGYGRGTTPEDKRNGNTSVGFHEWCHRMDYIRYIETQTLPGFDGAPGMSRAEYERRWERFLLEFSDLPNGLSEYSSRMTDEVGCKKSEYDPRLKRCPRKKGKLRQRELTEDLFVVRLNAPVRPVM